MDVQAKPHPGISDIIATIPTLNASSCPSNSDNLHHEYGAEEEEPCQSLQYLGHGGCGSVDEVVLKRDPHQKHYARKQVFLNGRGRQEKLEQMKKEARIIRSLRHRHIVEVIGTYTWSSRFAIIMSPVADTDLRKYLEELDAIPDGKRRNDWISRLLWWPGCLIQALNYLHMARVKHRDIKPSNILIRQGTIYLTDFGTSKDIPQGETTGTKSAYGDMTRRYVAPEALQDGGRRGRATDVFSLGCVFLEMSTVSIAPPDSRERFVKFCEELSGSTAFGENAAAILQWIYYLRGTCENFWSPLNLSFTDLILLMLDPEPWKRVKTRQLVALCSTDENYLRVFRNACGDCRSVVAKADDTISHPSPFTRGSRAIAVYTRTPEEASKYVKNDWEGMKQEWLSHHTWWKYHIFALTRLSSSFAGKGVAHG